MRPENTVWADVIGFFNSALSDAGISGWQVSRAYQPTQGKLEPPYILLHRTGIYPVGWQGVKYARVNGELKGTASQIYEYVFQADAVKKRTADASESTAEDTLRAIMMWLMSGSGLAALRAKGYGIARITDIRNPEFTDSNDVFEFRPNFTMKIYYEQTMQKTAPEVQGTEAELKQI